MQSDSRHIFTVQQKKNKAIFRLTQEAELDFIFITQFSMGMNSCRKKDQRRRRRERTSGSERGARGVGSECCLCRVVIDNLMICCDVPGGAYLGGSATSNKLHLFNLAQLCSRNGMMASAINMMKWKNK